MSESFMPATPTVAHEDTPPEPALFHEYANLFPMMTGKPYRELVEDVQANGVREPIVFLDGQILDGRNRYLAAREVGVAYPRIEFIGSDPLAYVISLNLKRRHLSESQRAMVAAKLAKLPKGSNQHTPIGGPSRQTAAELLNVGTTSVERAKMVQQKGTAELVDAVESGRVSVSAAADVAALPKDEQCDIVARGEAEILEKAKEIRASRVERKRQQKIQKTKEIAANNVALPAGERTYSVIYADPPWSFDVWSGAGKDRAAENHYPTMGQEEIEALPVEALAADDCALFLWACWPQLPEALAVIQAWGFEYKTAAFIWVKTTKDDSRPATGMGYWTRANSEVCLLATRGSPPRLNADVHQVIMSPRMEHSRKPDEAAERIERLVPGPYFEVFCRHPREGWDVWGNQSGAS